MTPAVQEDLPLGEYTPPAMPGWLASSTAYPVWRRRAVVLCARELRQLARRRGAFGVTADDTHQIALRWGWATGGEEGRQLSWYTSVPRVGRLWKTTRKRPGRNRNSHTVYVANREDL